jgi:chromosome segregation ATPase
VDDDIPVVGLDTAPDVTPDDRADINPVVRVLNQHIEKIEKQLEAAQAELREERTRSAALALQAAHVNVLNSVLEVERRRVEDLKAERDRWAAQTDPHRTTIEVLKAALDAEKERLSELREDRDRWRTAAAARRSWWPWRRSA